VLDPLADTERLAALNARRADERVVFGQGERSRARVAATANRRERQRNQMQLGFGPTQLLMSPDLVATFEEVGAGADESVAEVTIPRGATVLHDGASRPRRAQRSRDRSGLGVAGSDRRADPTRVS
jgi:hypothetical protein